MVSTHVALTRNCRIGGGTKIELGEGCPSHAFEACAFGRSATPPGVRLCSNVCLLSRHLRAPDCSVAEHERKDRDSNPGRTYEALTRLAGEHVRPLCHPSVPDMRACAKRELDRMS